jgi:hypothetical protein
MKWVPPQHVILAQASLTGPSPHSFAETWALAFCHPLRHNGKPAGRDRQGDLAIRDAPAPQKVPGYDLLPRRPIRIDAQLRRQ